MSFDGGVRRDKSLFELQKNELLDARNIELDEKGRVKIRRGSFQVGQTLSGTLENSFVWERVVAGSTPVNSIYVNDNASPATIRRLLTDRLTTAITSASTTVVIAGNATNYAANGTIEIEGDLIAYTGNNGSDTFTGVTGIVGNHAAGASVNQWASLTMTTAIDGREGVYYAVLNNSLVIGGRAGAWNVINNDDGVTTSAITGEPSAIFHTNYRDRIYVAGDGGSSGDPRTVFYSARGDGTSWTTASDFFTVEDQRGEGITGFRSLSDNLLIFKTNSLFAYDEVELKQRISGVGAWNHKVPVEIDGLIYTFCPRGIFATNGSTAKQIGAPVQQYWENFQPQVDSITVRVVTNTFAARFQHYYILYIHNITDPTTTSDVVLVYDTIGKNWQVWTGFTNIRHLLGGEKYTFGDRRLQLRPVLFGGDTGGRYFRFFESRYVDGQSTPVNQGGDIFTDLVSNAALNAGTLVNGMIETPFYDMTHPELFKKIKGVRFFAEQGQWNVEYRIENEQGITQYRSLGTLNKTNQFLPLPKNASGFRHGFRISGVNTASISIFNGLIFEDIELTPRQ